MRQQLIRSAMACAAVAISSFSFCQGLTILPKWKRDEMRTMYITRTQKAPAVNETGEPEERVIPYKTSAKVKVYDLTPQVVLVSIDHENMVLPLLKPYFETGFPMEVEPFRRMIIRYEVDRTTGHARLLNASDLKEFVKRAADHCLRILRKKDQVTAVNVEASLKPMLQQFDSEASIESYINDHLGFLFASFGKELDGTAPLVIEEITQLPFSAGDSALVRSTYTLLGRSDEQAELKILKELAQPSIQVNGRPAISKVTTANEADRTKSWHREQLVTMDLRTTWPIRMIANTRIELSDGTGISEETSIEIR